MTKFQKEKVLKFFFRGLPFKEQNYLIKEGIMEVEEACEKILRMETIVHIQSNNTNNKKDNSNYNSNNKFENPKDNEVKKFNYISNNSIFMGLSQNDIASPTIKGFIKDTEVIVTIDTGADKNYISEKLRNIVKIKQLKNS